MDYQDLISQADLQLFRVAAVMIILAQAFNLFFLFGTLRADAKMKKFAKQQRQNAQGGQRHEE